MCTKFLLKVVSYKFGSRKLLPFSRARLFLCASIKSSILRTTATVASGGFPKDHAEDTNCPGETTPSKNFISKYFLNQEGYRDLVFDRNNLSFATEGRPESVQILKNLTDGSEDEELIEKLKSSLLKEKEFLNVEEICKSLYLTHKYRNNHLAEEIVSLLETELRSRILSKSEIVKVLFAFSQTWGTKNRFLAWKLSEKFLYKIESFSPKELVVFFCCKFICSKTALQAVKYNVTKYVTDILPSLDSVELGIIAKGLLYGKFSISKFDLRKNMMQRSIELSGSIHEDSLKFICSFLNESIKYYDAPALLEFQENLIPRLSKFKPRTLNKVVATGSSIGCLNLNLWEKVANIFKENINNCDLNIVSSLVSTMTDCDISDEELLTLAIKKFERAVEDGTVDNALNRKVLISFLNNLIHHRIYPKNLLDVAFAEGLTFFKTGDNDKKKYSFNVKVKYWETKCLLDIDKPEFNYNSFDAKEVTQLTKLCKYKSLDTRTLNYLNNHHHILWKVRTKLSELYGGDENVYLSTWSPAYESGLFMRFDQNLNAQPIPVEFKSLEAYYPKRALKDEHIWVFVRLLPFYHCFGTEKVKLKVETSIRQLQAFGFQPIVVQYNTFTKHLRENTENEYLNNLINGHLHKTS